MVDNRPFLARQSIALLTSLYSNTRIRLSEFAMENPKPVLTVPEAEWPKYCGKRHYKLWHALMLSVNDVPTIDNHNFMLESEGKVEYTRRWRIARDLFVDFRLDSGNSVGPRKFYLHLVEPVFAGSQVRDEFDENYVDLKQFSEFAIHHGWDLPDALREFAKAKDGSLTRTTARADAGTPAAGDEGDEQGHKGKPTAGEAKENKTREKIIAALLMKSFDKRFGSARPSQVISFPDDLLNCCDDVKALLDELDIDLSEKSIGNHVKSVVDEHRAKIEKWIRSV